MGNAVIYRPAYDAEIEYLESTGTQWIDTGVNPNNTYTFDCKVAVTQDNYNCVYWGTRNSGDSESENNQCYLNSNSIHGIDSYHEINLYSTSTDEPSNWSSNVIPSVNTMYELTGMTVVPTMNTMIYPITLFAFNMIGYINTWLGKCRIGYWKCYSNGQIVRDFIPVRIGQVGYMYDKVSKQLFANKGTGQFILGSDVSNAVIPQHRCVLYFGSQRSVIYERIYEEYEWLCGDGQAYINTKVGDLSDVDYITCYLSAVDVYTENRIFGREGTTYTRIVSSYDGVQNGISLWIGNISQGLLAFPTKEGRLTINIVDEIASTDDDSLSFVTPTDLNGRNFYLFGDNGYNKIFSGKIKSFEIDKKINLVPCKLLQPIPSILDGNGIARQAGECGMWDKVNNRFYGNVANNGSFTVSNS